MDLGTRLFTWLRGEFVGEDTFGNRYYRERKAVRGRRRHRWVAFNGAVEATKVPPEWHAWLHYTADAPLGGSRRPWQKDHLPNLSGTSRAWFPKGHASRGGVRAHATGDYEPWRPE